jgi:hypothetical protein
MHLTNSKGIIDIVEPTTEPLTLSRSNPPLVLPEVVKKNDQNSIFDEDFLIEKIAPSLQKKAKLLIDAFNKNPQQVSWNETGELMINEQGVPNANIYQLLPAVFKSSTVKNRTLPGFIEFVTQIGTMGLGKIISPKLLRGLKRKTTIQNQTELYSDIIKNDKWYYLGPI